MFLFYLFEEALISHLSGIINEMIVSSQLVIRCQQKQKLKTAISDVAVKGGSNAVILKGYVRVRKTHEPFQVFLHQH